MMRRWGAEGEELTLVPIVSAYWTRRRKVSGLGLVEVPMVGASVDMVILMRWVVWILC